MRKDFNPIPYVVVAMASVLSGLPASAQLIWYDGLGTCPSGDVLISKDRQRYMIETIGSGNEELDLEDAVASLNMALVEGGCVCVIQCHRYFLSLSYQHRVGRAGYQRFGP